MIIHLIGSMRKFEEDLRIMRKIAETIESSGSQIALNWFQAVKDRKDRNSTAVVALDWPEIVSENIATVTTSDALIIEGSRFNYSQGYQTAIALAHHKPVLNLYREDSTEYKEWPDKFFVSGISHPLFTNKAYKDETDLEEIVKRFLKNHAKKVHEIDLKIAVDDVTYNKIEKLSETENKSKASIIKEIVSRNI